MNSHRFPLPAAAGALSALVVTAASLGLAASATASVTPQGPSIAADGSGLDGSRHDAGFTASLSGTTGKVSYVKWILDGTYLGKDTTAPYSLMLSAALPGVHTLRARLHATDGTETKSQAVWTQATGAVVVVPTPTPVPPTTAPPTTAPPTAAPATSAPASTPSPTGSAVHVSDGAGLAAALAAARPGSVITLADGSYTTKTQLTISASCTASAPCTLTGGRGAVLDGGGIGGSYGLHLLGASYWTLSGFSVANAAKGIVLDGSSHNLLTGVQVSSIGDEGIHLRAFSRDDVVRSSLVHDTGLKAPQYGEGIYVGSAKSNWGTFSGGAPDTSDRNQVLGNTIYRTGAESVDIKEGTTAGVLADNSFDGAGMSGKNYADSWVDVKGNGWTVRHNVGINALTDGFQAHQPLTGWGTGNVFQGNVAAVNSTGYGFNLQNAGTSNNVVRCDNVVTGAAAGLANLACSP